MRASQRTFVLAWILLLCPLAFALNPALDINQYAHTAWRVRDGVFKGVIWSVAQTPDGYLWAGTEFGVLRFDGVRFVQWTPPPGEHLPSDFILRLLVTRDGGLWIGTAKGVASWRNSKLTHYAELDGQNVLALAEDTEGAVWVGTQGDHNGSLCAIDKGRVHCDGQDGRFGFAVASIYPGKGDLWAGAATGLWRWMAGSPKRYEVPGVHDIESLIEGDNQRLWLGTANGIMQLVNEKVEPYAVQVSGRVEAYRFLRDREGGLWIATWGRGLLHVHQGRTDFFGSADGLTSDYIFGLLEDREGNIWAATKDGLDRFREYVIPSMSFRQGLSGKFVDAVLATRDGSIWLSTPDGLDRWNKGEITIYRKRAGSRSRPAPPVGVRELEQDGLPDNVIESLYQDHQGRIWVATGHGLAYFEGGRFVSVSAVPSAVYNLEETAAGDLWVNDAYRGLLHFMRGKLAEQIPWASLGQSNNIARALIADPSDGGLWLGFRRGGLAYFKEGQVRARFTVVDGLGKGDVGHLRFDTQGALWASTDGGLSRLNKGRITTLTRKNGLPCDSVHSSVEDDFQAVWMNTACGLVRVTRLDLDAWLADSKHVVSPGVFDNSDGVRSTSAMGGYGPRIAKSPDGTIWFATYDGVSVFDPRHLPTNKLMPPVHIEKIIADHKAYAPSMDSTRLRLPPLVRDLEIDYTALSLAAPERVRFRYKLEGRDKGWRDDPDNARRAIYNDLPPRNYRFRVSACNNNGVWNDSGAAVDFLIAPAYYQTTWFEALCVALPLILLWGVYRYRVHQIAQHFNVRLEERLTERTRIARELHDTLLQSFQGLMFRLQAVDDLLPGGKAKDQLERALERADQAIAEGRTAVYDLRSSATMTNDLAMAIKSLGEELTAADSAAFRLIVEGAPRDLHPIVRDEIYRIAREALRNAFSHAEAHHIETEITYAERALRLRIRDDGNGIPAEFLEEGRRGHYGLCGMRERARQIGGKVDIWSRPGAGTEVELSVVSGIAYRMSISRSVFGFFRRKGNDV